MMIVSTLNKHLMGVAWHRVDDAGRTLLRAQLAELRPVELVLPREGLSEGTRKVLKAALRAPRTNLYAPLPSAVDVVGRLESRAYFGHEGADPADRECWPKVIRVSHWDRHPLMIVMKRNPVQVQCGLVKFSIHD
jgi:hypothetical protein